MNAHVFFFLGVNFFNKCLHAHILDFKINFFKHFVNLFKIQGVDIRN